MVDSGYLVAFLLGLFSTLHCWGMCGGIITALSMNLAAPIRNSRQRLLCYSTAYNLGRITSYTLAGLLAGMLGGVVVISTAGYGLMVMQWLAGIVLILAGLRLVGWTSGLTGLEQLGHRIWRRIQPLGRWLLPVNSLPRAWLMGMIWGLLPCGLVYSALLLALAEADTLAGAGLMLSFGLGTLPGMVAAGFVSGRLQQWVQQIWLRRVAGVILIGFGVLVPLWHSPWSHQQADHGGAHSIHQHAH